MTAAVALGLQGCSDWDDHYDVNGNNLNIVSYQFLDERRADKAVRSSYYNFIHV